MSKNSTAIKNAETYCVEHGLQFTEPRRLVFEVIVQSDKPVTAYDILDEAEKLTGKKPKPPTIYRAIDFLSQHGFIHRIESLNAFVTCSAGHRHQGSQFLVCDQCGRVQEAHLCHLPKGLSEKAESLNFQPQSWSIEIHGLCSDCRA